MAFDSKLGGVHLKRSNAFLLLLFLVVVMMIIVGKSLSMPEKTSKNDDVSMQKCMHPGYGDFNTHSIKLNKREIIVRTGEQIEVKGNITGKAFHVGNETCYYDGNVTLNAYTGPKISKDSWSYASGKLREVKGLNVKITPGELRLKPNETVEFRVEITPQKSGTYYLYIVASGGKGWKSWDVIEVEVG